MMASSCCCISTHSHAQILVLPNIIITIIIIRILYRNDDCETLPLANNTDDDTVGL